MEDLGCGCGSLILVVLIVGFALDVCKGMIGVQVLLIIVAAALLLLGIVGIRDAFK
jgi:hypothetical protein